MLEFHQLASEFLNRACWKHITFPAGDLQRLIWI